MQDSKKTPENKVKEPSLMQRFTDVMKYSLFLLFLFLLGVKFLGFWATIVILSALLVLLCLDEIRFVQQRILCPLKNIFMEQLRNCQKYLDKHQ